MSPLQAANGFRQAANGFRNSIGLIHDLSRAHGLESLNAVQRISFAGMALTLVLLGTSCTTSSPSSEPTTGPAQVWYFGFSDPSSLQCTQRSPSGPGSTNGQRAVLVRFFDPSGDFTPWSTFLKQPDGTSASAVCHRLWQGSAQWEPTRVGILVRSLSGQKTIELLYLTKESRLSNAFSLVIIDEGSQRIVHEIVGRAIH